MSDEPRRPLQAEDYRRALLFVHAATLAALEAYEENGRTLGAVIRAMAEETPHPDLGLDLNNILDDELAARERDFTLTVLEAGSRGFDDIPVETRTVPTVCATPKCANAAAWYFCIDCQIRHMLEEEPPS